MNSQAKTSAVLSVILLYDGKVAQNMKNIQLQSPFMTTINEMSIVRQINLSHENIENKHWCSQISKIVSQKIHFGNLICI